MVESLARLRARAWPLLIGMLAGGAAVVFAGPGLFWGLVALGLAALLIVQFITFQEPILRPAEQDPDEPLALLPPLTRLLLERLPIPVMLLDDNERVLFVNHSMRDVLGPGLDRKRASSVLRNPDVLAAIAGAGRGESSDVPFTLPVPVERHFQAYAARISVAPPVTVLLLHDLTVRRSEQMRADFVANASHELRTPLAAVTGFIETLRGHAKDDADAREQFLEIMATETARMRRLIDDLLSLTRIEMNEHVKPEGRIGLESVVRQAAAALKPLAAQDGITVTVEAGAGVPDVIGDQDELVQLFQNLIHNAIKYGREKGKVQVTIGRLPDGQVFAAVRDDGEGIAPGAIPRLTERFYRVDVKRSRERGGTGLGLAIVKHIVSRHQGRLSIESKLGEGSTFTVFLPAAPPEIQQNRLLPEPVTEML